MNITLVFSRMFWVMEHSPNVCYVETFGERLENVPDCSNITLESYGRKADGRKFLYHKHNAS